MKVGKYAGQYRFVMRVGNYAKVDEKNILAEAATHSGLSRGQVRAAWESIKELVGIYVTEGLSVSLPGLGTMRMGISAKSAENQYMVKDSLIKRRRIVFTPDVEIKEKINNASIAIVAVDRNGAVVDRKPDGSGTTGSSGGSGSSGNGPGSTDYEG